MIEAARCALFICLLWANASNALAGLVVQSGERPHSIPFDFCGSNFDGIWLLNLLPGPLGMGDPGLLQSVPFKLSAKVSDPIYAENINIHNFSKNIEFVPDAVFYFFDILVGKRTNTDGCTLRLKMRVENLRRQRLPRFWFNQGAGAVDFHLAYALTSRDPTKIISGSLPIIFYNYQGATRIPCLQFYQYFRFCGKICSQLFFGGLFPAANQITSRGPEAFSVKYKQQSEEGQQNISYFQVIKKLLQPLGIFFFCAWLVSFGGDICVSGDIRFGIFKYARRVAGGAIMVSGICGLIAGWAWLGLIGR